MTELSGPTGSTPAPPAVTSAAPAAVDAAPDVFAPPFTGRDGAAPERAADEAAADMVAGVAAGDASDVTTDSAADVAADDTVDTAVNGADEPADTAAVDNGPPPSVAAEHGTDPWAETEEGTVESAWDTHETLPEDRDGDFPLDAFIIPDDARTVPAGLRQKQDDASSFVADRLTELADRIRKGGLAALADQASDDALAGVIANAIAVHLSRTS